MHVFMDEDVFTGDAVEDAHGGDNAGLYAPPEFNSIRREDVPKSQRGQIRHQSSVE